MRDTKRRLETFSFYDHTGIEAHLARMAERGWMLDKIGQFFWTYRRIEPKKMTFSVAYFPKASQFDPCPSLEQQTFYDFCEHTGWILAASSAQLQVFCNERPDPLPIDTDPMLEIDAIHQSVKKSWLLSLFSLLAVTVMQASMFLAQLFDDPVKVLSSALTLFVLVNEALLLLLISVELASYYFWRRRAKRAAEQGCFLETRSHPLFQRFVLAAVLAGFVWLLASLASGGDPGLALVMGGSVCAVFTVAAVVWGISGWLKRQKASADTNRTITFTLTIVLSFAVVLAIPLMILGMNRNNTRSAWELRRDEPPLTLPGLLDQPAGEDWNQSVRYTQSPLLGYLTVWQRLGGLGPGPATSHWMSYTMAVVKAPFLYDLCRDSFLDQMDSNAYVNSSYVPTDPAPWGAAEAYLECDEESGPQNQYLLCYPDRVVQIYFDWDITPEQMKIVGEKLGG